MIRENSGQKFVEEYFSNNKSKEIWFDLICEHKSKKINIHENIIENYNFLRLLNLYIRKIVPFLPPLVIYEFLFLKLKRRVRIILGFLHLT